MRKLTYLVAAAATSLLPGAAQAQDLLLNGGFEIDGPVFGGFDITVKRQDDGAFPGNRHLLNTGAAGAGWFTDFGGNTFEIWDAFLNPNWNDGFHLELQNDDTGVFGSSTFQDFTPAVTGTYRLSFLYGFEGQADATAPFDTTVVDQTNSVTVFSQNFIAQMDVGQVDWHNNVWTSFTTSLNLTAGNSYRLNFRDARINDGKYAQTHIDSASVTLQSTSVAPEPASLALFAAIGGVGALRRRRA